MLRRINGLAAAVTVAAPLTLVGGSVAPAAATTTCSRVAQLDSVTYADRLVRAWGRGDRATASCYANVTTVRALFAQATPGSVHWRRTTADGAAGTIYVTYHDDARGGNLTIGVQNVGLRAEDGLHAAYRASFHNEPPAWGPVAWSDNLVRAWGRGDKKWMSYYATPAVVRKLTHISPTGGPSWRRVAAEGAAGTTYVTYHNDANGHQLVVGISNVLLSQDNAHTAYTLQYH